MNGAVRRSLTMKFYDGWFAAEIEIYFRAA